MVTSDSASGFKSSSNQPPPQHEAAPYERVIFNGAVYRDDRAREMLFGGARAQLVQQQHDQANALAIANKQPSANLMRAAQLPNQRRQTAIGIQATSSSSGSENDSASYSQSQLASKSGSGYHQTSHHRPPAPPPLSLQSLQQPNSSNIINVHNNAVETPVANLAVGVTGARQPQNDHRISAVLHAISNGRVSMLRSVWSPDLPLYVDEHKNTVLHWCAKYEGAAKCLKWLIKNTSVPLSSRNFRGELCTHVAARHGVLSCLKVALMSANGGHGTSMADAVGGPGGHAGTDRLFSATEKDKRGFTILHLAVIKQRFPIVRWLTKQTFSALLVRIADNNNNLPLHYAALRGSKKMAQLLLKKNKDMLNLRNISGATPLHVAAFEGRSVAFVQWLVEEVGADATAVMESGVNLLHVAAAGGSIQVVRYLLSTTRQPAEAVLSRSQDGSTIFHFSAANGHAHLLQWLWAQRGNSSSRTGSAGSLPSSTANKSPLSTALAAGIHLRNTLGNSPAHAAAEAGQASTFRQLVEFGADIFGKNKAGFSALEVALSNKNPALVRLAEDIRRLLLDPNFATTPEASNVPGQHHLTTNNIRSSSELQGIMRAPSVQQQQQAIPPPPPPSSNLAASSLSGYHSKLTSSFGALHLPEMPLSQQQHRGGENRLQMQLHIATSELGTLDGDNENDDAVDGLITRPPGQHNNEDNEELFVVKRVNENVFLKQGDVPQQQQQSHRPSSSAKAPAQTSYGFSNWRDRIFPQKGRRQSAAQISSATSTAVVNNNPQQFSNVPELSQLMSQEQQQMLRNQQQQFYRGNNNSEIVGEDGDYWDRLSTDIRRLLVLRRYP